MADLDAVAAERDTTWRVLEEAAVAGDPYASALINTIRQGVDVPDCAIIRVLFQRAHQLEALHTEHMRRCLHPLMVIRDV